ncbi:MAG TPA: CYTH domain-containing protein [Myxococcota bacterium]
MEREVELKLEISPRELARLQRHPRVRALSTGPARTATLRSVYFDTRDLALARRGMGLRLRWMGGRRRPIQTLKLRGAGATGLFERGEVECSVSGARPDLDALPDAALRRRLRRALAGAALEPVFETRMRRTSRVLREGRDEWSLDLDVGEARTARRRAPFCELELELRRGRAARLYGFALELAQTIALLPDARSKADRGYALLPRACAPAARPTRFALRPDHSVGQALDGVLRSAVERLTRDVRALLDAETDRAVEALEGDVRRVCAVLEIFAGVLPAQRVRRIRAALEPIGDASRALLEVEGFTAPCRAKRLPRVARLSAVRARLRAPGCAHALLDLGALLAAEATRGAARRGAVRSRRIAPFATAQLERLHRGVRRELERRARTPGAAPRSLCRAVADLREAVELFRPLLRGTEWRDYRRRLAWLARRLEWIEAGRGAAELAPRVRGPARGAASACALRRAQRRAARAARELARPGALPGRPPRRAPR